MNENLNGENVDIQMSTLMLNCTSLAFFERSLISTLWDRLYSESHKVATQANVRKDRGMQMSRVLIDISMF